MPPEVEVLGPPTVVPVPVPIVVKLPPDVVNDPPDVVLVLVDVVVVVDGGEVGTLQLHVHGKSCGATPSMQVPFQRKK